MGKKIKNKITVLHCETCNQNRIPAVKNSKNEVIKAGIFTIIAQIIVRIIQLWLGS